MLQISDKDWRLRTLYYIIDKDSKKILYKQNEIQSLVKSDKSDRKMILKARQFGVSTHCIIDIFDDTIFIPNTTSVIMAHENDSIIKLFRIVRRLYEFMPEELRPVLDRGGGSKNELFFPEINSRIYCDLESRGDTINRLHVSECAFMKDQSRLNSTLQAVPLNGKVTIETTANGMANHFYDMWNDPDSIYSKLFFPWYLFSGYKIEVNKDIVLTDEEKDFVKKANKLFGVKITKEQIQFRRFKKAELRLGNMEGKRVTFEQEYPEDDQTCFLSSGNAVFDLINLKKLIQNAKKPILDKGWLKIYEEHKKHLNYVIGADTAEGIGGDYSVGVVYEVETKSIVAKIRGHWKPFEFAHKLYELAKIFKAPKKLHPKLAVERNNHGHAVLLELREHINYDNLFVDKDDKLGWKTDSVSRPIMINTFINAVDENAIEINDIETLNECLTLINNKGKIEAADGKHDDCIVASSIGLQIVSKSINLSMYENLEKRILL